MMGPNSLSVRVGRVSLHIDLPAPVMSEEVFNALQQLQEPVENLARMLDAYSERSDIP